jgi:hypothetical protein
MTDSRNWRGSGERESTRTLLTLYGSDAALRAVALELARLELRQTTVAAHRSKNNKRRWRASAADLDPEVAEQLWINRDTLQHILSQENLDLG